MAVNLDLGTIFELINGVASSVKRGENGKTDLGIDPQKLGMVLASFAGRQVVAQVMNRRQRKTSEMEQAMAYLRDKAGIKPAKKKIGALPFLIFGAVGSLVVYVVTLKPEERAQLFKNVDRLINQVGGLANEIQGRPYTADYEASRS